MYIKENEKYKTRAYTNKLIEGLDMGIFDPYEMALSLLGWLSEDEVQQFAETYEYVEEYDEEDDE